MAMYIRRHLVQAGASHEEAIEQLQIFNSPGELHGYTRKDQHPATPKGKKPPVAVHFRLVDSMSAAR